jgi:hypothetical protein
MVQVAFQPGALRDPERCTRWFKYDRDDLCVNKSQFVPVIFQPPCKSVDPVLPIRLTTCCGITTWGLWTTLYTGPVSHSDFRLLGPIKKLLTGKRFATDVDVKQVVTSWLQTHDTDFFFNSGIQALVPQWDKCLNTDGDCVEVRCVPSATHVPSIH